MKKNSKKTVYTNNNINNAYTRFGIEAPRVTDIDVLSIMNEDDLDRILHQLQNERNRVENYDLDAGPWEVEICYIQRELKIRAARRVAHDQYLKTLSAENVAEEAFDDEESEEMYFERH